MSSCIVPHQSPCFASSGGAATLDEDLDGSLSSPGLLHPSSGPGLISSQEVGQVLREGGQGALLGWGKPTGEIGPHIKRGHLRVSGGDVASVLALGRHDGRGTVQAIV